MREEKQLQNSTCKTQQRVHVEELGVNGEVILKWILNSVECGDWIYWAQGSFRVAGQGIYGYWRLRKHGTGSQT